MRKYAVKDGDYGLWYDDLDALTILMHRVNGGWRYYINGGESVALTIGGPIYRLTGWGADGPTEMWVEPLPPVEVKVGMAVMDAFLAYGVGRVQWGSQPSPEDVAFNAERNPASVTTVTKITRSKVEDRVYVSGRVKCCAHTLASRATGIVGNLVHYPTGAPLCLPKEPSNDRQDPANQRRASTGDVQHGQATADDASTGAASDETTATA